MKRKIVGLMVVVLLINSISVLGGTKKTEAATIYITVSSFAQALSIEIGLTSTDEESEAVIALQSAGIIKEGDFVNFDNNLTRGDMLVLLNRTDEYVNQDTVEDQLINIVIEKRISDIKEVPEAKRTDIGKGYIKGFMKGYNNGNYITNRNLKLTSKVTRNGALSCIKMIKDKSLRAKISPDGQLIRTTKLPKYAKYYPYILESFPNKYYDWKFQYEDKVKYRPETNKEVKYEYLIEYAPPIDVDKTTYFDNFKEVKEEYLSTWVEKVRNYVDCTFNVDYRTIDDAWVKKMLSSDYSYGQGIVANQAKQDLEEYINNMKKNRTAVESSIVAVDGSSLFFFDGYYYLRVYVKYRIKSSNIKYGVDVDTLIAENSYGNILYSRLPLVYFNKYSIGKWKDFCFDVQLAWYSQKNPDGLGVSYAILDEAYYEKRRVDK